MRKQDYILQILQYYSKILLKNYIFKFFLFIIFFFFFILIITKKDFITNLLFIGELDSAIIPISLEKDTYVLDKNISTEAYSNFLQKNQNRKYFIVSYLVDPNKYINPRTDFYYKVRIDACMTYPGPSTWTYEKFLKILLIKNKGGVLNNELIAGYYFLATDEMPTLDDFHKGLWKALQNLPNNYKVEDKSIISQAYKNKIPYKVYNTEMITNYQGESAGEVIERRERALQESFSKK